MEEATKKKRVVHVIGNGDNAFLYNNEPAKGIKLVCNMPPFPVVDQFASVVVDFKMCKAITEGSIIPPGQWVMGFRPKMWCDKHPNFYMKHAWRIREFFTEKPKYVKNYTDFNCGHVATYYAIKKLKASEIHMYGFDSLFDLNNRSCSDFYLQSDRAHNNTYRLANNWRPIWEKMFAEFTDTKFVLYHNHEKIKIDIPNNVEIVVRKKKKKKVIDSNSKNVYNKKNVKGK